MDLNRDGSVMLTQRGEVEGPAHPRGVFFFFLIYLFIYFWLCWVFVAVLGLSLVAVSGLLIAVTSLVVEHGL